MSTDDRLAAFLSGYHCPQRVFDELCGKGRAVSAHWQTLLGQFAGMTPEELSERLRKLERVLRDDGASYTELGGEGTPAARIWALDPVPHLIDEAEWQQLQAGLAERAQIVDLLLRDIYGSQRLIHEGVLPPELVYANAAFLRPCHGVLPQNKQQLIFYAVDLMRCGDGQLRVIGDRTQAPVGVGFALENRAAMARVLPELFRPQRVHRLGDFFHDLRAALDALSPLDTPPQIALLTAGPRDINYFEHAYLANFQGFPVVRGGDLTLRDGNLWMKGVEGLDRVDVLLRFVEDYDCDPVELNDESVLGVAGLLDAARRGRVSIANPLGSGVLENPAVLKYFERVAKHFLGRAPLLQSVPSYWCGDPDDLQQVLERLPELVIKRMFRKVQRDRYYGYLLSEKERENLRVQIRAAPHHFCAQELQTPARLPALVDGGLVARPSALRCFAVADGTGGYRAMPGGLSRIGASDSPYVMASAPGMRSKDTWVLGGESWSHSARDYSRPLAILARRHRTYTPSRVVENLFWMGRYSERTEMTARLLRTVYAQRNSADGDSDGMRQLLIALSHTTGCLPGFDDGGNLWRAPAAELQALAVDRSRPGSVGASLQAMLGAAEEVKELLSEDSQRIANALCDQLEGLPVAMEATPEEALQELVSGLLGFSGLLQESVMRDIGWYFIDIGKRLERAQQVLTLLQYTCVEPAGDLDRALLLESVLLSVEALITYRQHYSTQLCLADTLELLLLDAENPRGLIYQLNCLQLAMDKLPGQASTRGPTRARRALLEAMARVQLCSVAQLSRKPEDGLRHDGLDRFICEVRALLIRLATAISDQYFEHLAERQLLGHQDTDEEY